MIVCPLCNKKMKILNHTHLKTHNLSVKDFKIQFIDYEMVSIESSKNLSRKNNINHIKCIEKESIRRKEKTKKNFKILNKKCKHCTKPILFEKRRNNFCNHSCCASFNLKGRKVVYSPEALKIMQENGRKHIPKRKAVLVKKVCVFCKENFEIGNKRKYRKTCSKECLKEHQSLNNARQGTYGKCGYYKGIFCGSTWELAFLIFNLDRGNEIKRCELTFRYELEDGIHTYFPDFIMDNIIYEVKGREYGSLVEKNEAVEKAGYEIIMIKKKEINPIIKVVKESFKVKNLVELYDKRL